MPAYAAVADGPDPSDDAAIRKLIEGHRPSRLKALPTDFNDRVGAAHVAGKYHLTSQPFLLEGAAKLLALGSRLGKFWFMPTGVGRDYPFNSDWARCTSLKQLSQTEYFQKLFALPFSTFILETPLASDDPARVKDEYGEFAAGLYELLRERKVTVIVQHWEGDWLLRGRAGELWDPPPTDWKQRCARMVKQLEARQAGIAAARREQGVGTSCRVLHAAEVNRVADLRRGIPTMTEQVLPNVEVDLVSYSAYDGMKDGATLYRHLVEIRRHTRTTGICGSNCVFVGEIGLPENEQPERIADRWDEWLGAMLAAQVPYIAMWELYCNELNPRVKPPPSVPVKNGADLRGFWLVKPDGELSETGRFFRALWQRKTLVSR